jgi:pantothenate kinase type III
MRILALDIGNSTCHAALFDGEDPLVVERWGSLERPAFAADLGRVPRPDRVAAVSVNRRAEPEVDAWVRSAGLEVLYVPKDLPHTIPLSVDRPETTGPDRVVAAAAALSLVGGPCVVVDAGTAVTVDRADPDRGFLGGTILPGLRLFADALHRGTSLLPRVEPEPVFEPLGRTTEEAVSAGVFLGWLGAVREVVGRMLEDYGACPVVATGGDAHLLVGEIPALTRMVPDLTLRGVALAARQEASDRHGT